MNTSGTHITKAKRRHILLQRIINYCIASVWLINGLYCKVLNQVPRHQQIVARITGNEYADVLTRAIGVSEILMSDEMTRKLPEKAFIHRLK